MELMHISAAGMHTQMPASPAWHRKNFDLYHYLQMKTHSGESLNKFRSLDLTLEISKKTGFAGVHFHLQMLL